MLHYKEPPAQQVLYFQFPFLLALFPFPSFLMSSLTVSASDVSVHAVGRPAWSRGVSLGDYGGWEDTT